MAVKPYQRTPGKWLFDYTDAHGRRKFQTVSSESSAKAIQSQRQTEWELIKEGVVGAEQVQQRRRAVLPLEQHIGEHEEHMRGKRVSEKHIKNTIDGLRRVVKWLGVTTAPEIDIGAIEVKFNEKMAAGMSPRMRNFYCKALKSFCKILTQRGHLPKNPLDQLKAINEEVDQRNVSRPLTHAEFDAILAPLALPPAPAIPTRRQWVKGERRLFYFFVARTGMRWEETARLRWKDVDGAEWWLDVEAKNTKGKRKATLPIPADLIGAVEDWRQRLGATPAPDTLIFPHGMPRLKTWKRDLVSAGIVKAPGAYASKARKGKGAKKGYRDVYAATDALAGYSDANGACLHRKSLRLTFGTWLYEAGVDIRVAQRLMRHQDVNLTSKIYTRPRLVDLQNAANQVPGAGQGATDSQARQAG